MTARRRLPLYGLVLAYGVSQLGTVMSGLAIPWLVLVTTGSAARTGLVGFAEMAPYVVAQAISGPVVDRFGLRRSCVTGNAAAAVLVGAIPALYALGALSLGSLFAVVAVAGAVRGAADAATSPLVPRAASFGGVPNERAAGLNSVAQRTGMLLGLPLAGVLIAVAGAPTVVLVDAVTFAAAALLIAAAVPAAAAKADDDPAAATSGQLTVRGYLSRLGDGMRFIRADRVIAGIALMVAIVNLLDVALDSVFIPVWVHTRLHQPSGLGLIGGAMAIGLVAGALAGTWLGHRMPRHLTYAVGFLLGGCPVFIALAFAASLPPVMVVAALGGLAGGALNPIIGAVTYERVPARLQASVLGAFRASAWIGIPFGALLGGTLAEGIGLRDALLVTGTAMFLTTLAPFVFPSWRGVNRRPQPLPSGEPAAVAH
ncbi:MAG: MFS transporter [Trebonia sp.]